MRRLLYVALLCLMAQVGVAGYPKYPGEITEKEKNAEPNWEAAEYVCPKTVTSKKGKHIFLGAGVYGYSLRYGKWNYIVPEPREHVQFRFEPKKEQAYLACNYHGLNTSLMIEAKDAIACDNVKGMCWKTDPYAGKKDD